MTEPIVDWHIAAENPEGEANGNNGLICKRYD